MPYKGGKRKKRRTHVVPGPITDKDNIPRSMVLTRGRVSKAVSELVADLRKMMMPYTAAKLRVKRSNTIKDFLHVAGPLGVTHFMLLSQTARNVIFRASRVPHGPTLTFRVDSYTLARQVKAAQKSPVDIAKAYEHSPLVVMHGFNSAGSDTVPEGYSGISTQDAMRMTVALIQNMFPQLQPATVKLKDCRRVVLVHFSKETGRVELRHYYVRAVPVGVSRVVKKLIGSSSHHIPDLSRLTDISELVTGAGGAGSDSEAEDEAAKVVLPQDFAGHGNVKAQQSSVKLAEIGPRLTLSLMKVEQGLCEGDVLYHSSIRKTIAEADALRAAAEAKSALKQSRRAEQQQNVTRKEAEKAAKKEAKEERKRARQEAALKAAASGQLGDEEDGDVEDHADDEMGSDAEGASHSEDSDDEPTAVDGDGHDDDFDDEDEGDFAEDASDDGEDDAANVEVTGELSDIGEDALNDTSSDSDSVSEGSDSDSGSEAAEVAPRGRHTGKSNAGAGDKRSRTDYKRTQTASGAKPAAKTEAAPAKSEGRKPRQGMQGRLLMDMQAKLNAAQKAVSARR